MCDRDNLAAWAEGRLSRRALGSLSLAGAAAACAPTPAGDAASGSLAAAGSEKVSFQTPDGTLDGELFIAAGGTGPGVILWPDIAGIRPAKRQMAARLAGLGYTVLLANPYYRDVAGQQFADFADFAGNGGFDKVAPWRGRFTVDTIKIDQSACAGWLRRHPAVDKEKGIGTQGYCMTGSYAVVGPAAHAAIKAGGSFHGGGLVRSDGASPHRTFRSDAHYLIAIARNDDAKAPDEKTALRTAADAARCQAEIEVYPADHGWCVPDSPSYDHAQAERAWDRLIALYAEAL